MEREIGILIPRSSRTSPHPRKSHQEEATFKQYKRYDNTKILHPINPKYNDIVLNKDKEYRIVGVVMEKKRYK